jgi:hypothetical protein
VESLMSESDEVRLSNICHGGKDWGMTPLQQQIKGKLIS